MCGWRIIRIVNGRVGAPQHRKPWMMWLKCTILWLLHNTDTKEPRSTAWAFWLMAASRHQEGRVLARNSRTLKQSRPSQGGVHGQCQIVDLRDRQLKASHPSALVTIPLLYIPICPYIISANFAPVQDRQNGIWCHENQRQSIRAELVKIAWQLPTPAACFPDRTRCGTSA